MNTMETKPAGPLLMMALDMIQAQANRAANDAIEAAKREGGLPDGTRFDLERRVWVLPPAPEKGGK